MKKFFHDYSYSVVKMFVNQFAIAIFGTSLAFATNFAHRDSTSFDTLTLVVSIFSAIFYLFLLYTQAWEIGAKDKISVDCGKKPYKPHTGLILSLLANIPNFILAILFTIGSVFGLEGFASGIRIIACLLQGMYFGTVATVSLPIGDEWLPLNALWPTFFLMAVPAMLTCWVAYIMGHKNIRILAKPPKGATESAKPKDRPKMK